MNTHDKALAQVNLVDALNDAKITCRRHLPEVLAIDKAIEAIRVLQLIADKAETCEIIDNKPMEYDVDWCAQKAKQWIESL